MQTASSENKIIGVIVLEREPHPSHIIFCMSPVTHCCCVAEQQLRLPIQFDCGSSPAYFARDKILSPPWRLMVEHNSVHEEKTKSPSIDCNEIHCECLCTAIRTGRTRRRLLILRFLAGGSKHFTGGRMEY